MAYTAPRTWTAGEYPTAAQFNQDLRDNVSFLANPPACKVTDTGGQSVADDTDTLLLWDTEEFDTDTMHSTSVNPGRITFTRAGLYVVTANVIFPTNGNGYRHARIRANGTTTLAEDARTSASVVTNIGHSLSVLYKAAAAQYAEVLCRQTTTAALTTTADSNFSAVWIGLG